MDQQGLRESGGRNHTLPGGMYSHLILQRILPGRILANLSSQSNTTLQGGNQQGRQTTEVCLRKLQILEPLDAEYKTGMFSGTQEINYGIQGINREESLIKKKRPWKSMK